MLFVELTIASLLIVVAGAFLTRYGDRLAEKTGLGGAWVGLVLLACATSLPELVTCLGAVTIPREPNLVFGDVLGSNAFNLLILVVLDILCGRESVLVQVGGRAMLSAALGLIMMLLVVIPLFLMQVGEPLSAEAGRSVWVASPVIFLAYLFAMRLIFRDERAAMSAAALDQGPVGLAGPGPTEVAHQAEAHAGGIRREAIALAIGAAIILGAGLWLSQCADRLARHPLRIGGRDLTLGHTFVGALLLAVVTSLPELVVTISSFRLGAHAMALGNLLGSNVFNMAIVPLTDVANWVVRGRSVFLGGDGTPPLNPTHVLTGLIPIAMTAVLMAGLAGRRRRRRLPAGWETILITAIYLAGLYLVFQGSAQPH